MANIDYSLYGTGLPGDPLGEASVAQPTRANGVNNSGDTGYDGPVAPPGAGPSGYFPVTYTNDLVSPSQQNGTRGPVIPASYTSDPNSVYGPQQDPYQLGIHQLVSRGDAAAGMRQQELQKYTDTVGQNYYGGIQARQGIIDQQQSALGQFSQAQGGLYNGLAGMNQGLADQGYQSIGGLMGSYQQAAGMDSQNVGQLGSRLGQADALDASNVFGLGQSLDQANAMDAANYGQLNALNGTMRQLTAGGYGADVTSSPQDLARQEAAYGALGGFANGDYDYTSQAAQAYADPEAVAAQKEVMTKLKGEMDPRLTDAERYLYMQSRLAEEQSNRGARDANLRELERSGMSGSTMALSNLNASSQQTATTRALADLGANAKAIDRSTQATRDYGNLASVVSGQSFQQAYGRGQAADQASQFNTNVKMQGTIAQGNEANQIRNANDALNEFNKAQSLQQQRFQDQYAADQQNAAWGRGVDVSNAGFQQSSNIARNAGIKSNAGFQQSQDMSRNAGAISDAQFTQSGNLSRNATNLTNAQLSNIGQIGQRATDQTKAGMQANSDWLTGTQAIGGQQMQAQRDNTTSLGMVGDAAFKQSALSQDAETQRNALIQKGLESQAEDSRAAAASAAASAEAEKQRHEAARPHSLLDILEFKSDKW
jgi:hypothetical protein